MFRKLSSCTLGLMLVSGAVAVHAQDTSQTLVFGILSTESSPSFKQDWQTVLDDMSKQIGIKVTPQYGTDYADLVKSMYYNKTQFAWLGNKAAIEAVDRASGEVFAHTVNTDGSLGYYSVIAVHKDSPHKSLDDILKNAKGINFGLGDLNSTSGYVVPNFYVFAQNNVNPQTAFKSVRNANHETNILAVANKQVDAAVFASDTLARMEERDAKTTQQLRQVWKSPLITADPIVWRKDMDQDKKTKIKNFFLGYAKSGPNAAQQKAVLNRLTLSGFQESTNTQLKPIRQLDLFKEKVKLESDTAMGAEEKKARLENVNRKLAALEKS
jgi:phosphonate transport system substrate-binding protein